MKANRTPPKNRDQLAYIIGFKGKSTGNYMFFPSFPVLERGFGLYDTEGYGVYMLSFESYEAAGDVTWTPGLQNSRVNLQCFGTTRE